ncbi:MAG: hypothetical protein J7J65_01795 [Candidatus Korarchaeota archaeon]|nr:hypothetical protein [Candidatus Korarchaeota archaeon]
MASYLRRGLKREAERLNIDVRRVEEEALEEKFREFVEIDKEEGGSG